MMILIKIMVFIAGILLSMRLVAALYRIIDLWYAIATEFPGVIGRILFWGAPTIALAVLLTGSRVAFLWGLAAFPIFYLLSHGLVNFLFRLLLMRKKTG